MTQTTENPMDATEYFYQGESYWSDSKGEFVEVKTMAVPYALRALNRIHLDYGMDHLMTPLCLALAHRVTQAGEITDVEVAPGIVMMRDPLTKKFTGAVKKYVPVSERAAVAV